MGVDRNNIHIVDIEGIFCKALVCGGPIPYKDHDLIWVCVVEDPNRMPELVDQLAEIPPRVEALSGVGDLPGFKRGQTKLSWKCELLGDLRF